MLITYERLGNEKKLASATRAIRRACSLSALILTAILMSQITWAQTPDTATVRGQAADRLPF